MLESGLQAAVSWDSLLCVYMVAMAISELYAKYLFFFFCHRVSDWYIPSVIFGGARPPQCVHWGGGRLPPAPPPCSAAPEFILHFRSL